MVLEGMARGEGVENKGWVRGAALPKSTNQHASVSRKSEHKTPLPSTESLNFLLYFYTTSHRLLSIIFGTRKCTWIL
jgi:hypothetical protein